VWYSAVVRALGIDYGDRRIGLALSDVTGLLASPWTTISHDGNIRFAAQQLVNEVKRLQLEEGGLDAIVIGLPRRLSGAANAQTARVRRLAKMIACAVDVPISLQDERLTSREADELLARRDRDWRRRKKKVDAMAAALILQDYLDSRSRVGHAVDADLA
jgi:putative holliday junction resolvase